jgi:quercetin dioxygenase-like cupin family protein
MLATALPLNRYPEDRQVTHRSLRVTRTWRPPGLSVPSHAHELACLALCLDGRFDETIGDAWHQIGRETLVVRPGGIPHANRYSGGDPSRALIVEFLPDALSAIRHETRLLSVPALFESPRFVSTPSPGLRSKHSSTTSSCRPFVRYGRPMAGPPGCEMSASS